MQKSELVFIRKITLEFGVTDGPAAVKLTRKLRSSFNNFCFCKKIHINVYSKLSFMWIDCFVSHQQRSGVDFNKSKFNFTILHITYASPIFLQLYQFPLVVHVMSPSPTIDTSLALWFRIFTAGGRNVQFRAQNYAYFCVTPMFELNCSIPLDTRSLPI